MAKLNRSPCNYDLIIIGGGPSSSGLLHGILTHIVQANASNKIRIAVVERGGKSREESSSHAHFEHEHESTVHLQHWFRAAHYTILDVPTGRAWGESTNIHPQSSDFDAWPGYCKERIMKGVDHVIKVMKKDGAVEMEVERILISDKNDSTEDNEQACHRAWGQWHPRNRLPTIQWIKNTLLSKQHLKSFFVLELLVIYPINHSCQWDWTR
eukprot:scaffold55934_cov25-Cyclotella_meneghiniana.AAC.4